METAISNLNTDIYDKLVDRAAMLRLYEKGILDKITVSIDGHQTRLSSLIENSSKRKLDTLYEKIDNELLRLASEVKATSHRALSDVIGDNISYMYQVLHAKVGNILNINRPEYRVSEDIILNRPLYKNTTLNQGWNTVTLSEKKRIEQLIRNGISKGLSESEMAVMVRKGHITDITRVQSIGLVQTAITSVRSQTDYEVYKANGKILRGWQYVAVLDSRTTPLCAHRDGHIYPMDDVIHLPPAHWRCRSTTTPIVKSYTDLANSESLRSIRKRNFEQLSPKEIAYYDGQTPLKESYNEWLKRQNESIQLRHFGNDSSKLSLFNSGQLTVDKFTNVDGRVLTIKQLRKVTDAGLAVDGDTMRFADAKKKLDALQLGAARPDELINNPAMRNALEEYYLLQAGGVDGTLSLTNYRGTLIGTKKATKNRVLNSPPTEDNLKYNALTGRYEDARMYQATPAVLENNLRLVAESYSLKEEDKKFIKDFVDGLEKKMNVNQRAVIADNLRIVFSRFRTNKEPWTNFKAVLNSQIKFDVMNASDYIETQLRKDQDLLKKLLIDNYIDPVLGHTQLQHLSDTFIDNIKAKNKWEDKIAPKIGRELRNVLDYKIPVKLKTRLDNNQLEEFYLRFANRLSVADMPDRDQLAVSLGRDLYNMANYRGSRQEWFNLGVKLLDDANNKGFYNLETYGVQKRRMKARTGGKYFGPYYETYSVNLRITDPRIQEYSKLTRSVEVGLRVSVTTEKNRLLFREGYKTYWIDDGIFGYYDTRIPITSTSSYSSFPEELIDKNMVDALNWASQSKYKIDKDYFDAVNRILYFVDDKGKSAYYNELNQYKQFIASRGDAYERFKAMEWLSKNDSAFSNHAFLDHRARIYDRGLISAQSGELFRPFLNTATPKNFSREGFLNLQDQIGSFLGGASDALEGRHNSLTILGRQGIAEKWRPELVKIGNHMLRGKPNDIRAILDSKFLAEIDGEEQGKVLRFALELAKIDKYLNGIPSAVSVVKELPPADMLARGKIALGSTRDTFDTIYVSGRPVGFISSSVVGKDIKIEAIYSDIKNKGYAANAIRAVVGNRSSFTFVEPKNKASMRLFESLGFRVEKTEKRDGILVNIMGRDNIGDPYSYANLVNLKNYKIDVALEQDASSSGAQIIALTTKNKQLAELSNVIPTNQKKRLYDEIARATYNDPAFKELNKKLGLTEKDLRKASKMQNMVDRVAMYKYREFREQLDESILSQA